MIGISAPPLTVKPFKEAAEWVLPNFGLWEIISEADHYLPDIKDDVKDLMETSNLKVSIHAPFSDINLAAFDRQTRKYSIDVLVEIFRIASDLDMGSVTIHPGSIGPIQYLDKPRVDKLTRQSLEEISELADEFSTSVALENMPDMFFATCKTAEEMETMLDGLNIDMCFDIGHANITGQLTEMLRLLPRMTNIHIHDNFGENDQHLELGKGNIDFEDVVGRLSSYTGNYVIEAKTLDQESALRSKAYIESLLE